MANWPIVERRVQVLGTNMSYFEAGTGPPVVFLHGGVASANMWRRVLPRVAPFGRCIAVDLVGTGHSDAPAGADVDSYTWQQHARHLTEFLELVGVTDNVTLVMHGWSPLAAYPWILQNRDRVRGLAFVEAIVAPFSYGNLDQRLRSTLIKARGESGQHVVVGSDLYFDRVIRSQTQTPLDAEVSAGYRRTHSTSRLALYAALTSLPIGGEPRDAVELARAGNTWLCDTNVAKLIVLGRPGSVSSLIPNETLTRAPNLTVATVPGRHLLAEDSPESLALCLNMWLARLGFTTHTKKR